MATATKKSPAPPPPRSEGSTPESRSSVVVRAFDAAFRFFASLKLAVFCLANDLADLEARLGRMIVGYNRDKKPVTAADIKAVSAMTVLLKDAMKPNLVQTLMMINSPYIENKIRQGTTVNTEVARNDTDEALVRGLYMRTFCRAPNPSELSKSVALLKQVPDRHEGAQDLLWALPRKSQDTGRRIIVSPISRKSGRMSAR